jgi:hypothetical protein
MEVLVGGRQCGKTHQLALWASKDRQNRFIVCMDHQRAAWVRRHFDVLLRPEQVVTVDNARDVLRGRPGVEVGIDDADEVIRRAVGRDVAVAAVGGHARLPVLVDGICEPHGQIIDYTGEWT